MRFVLVIGTTETASIDGISAAGATRELMTHTPSADAEIVEYGKPVYAPVTPISPSGCPTPAVMTRGVRELIDFDLTVIESGLSTQTAAPTVELGDQPGLEIRESSCVPNAEQVVESARTFGQALPTDEVVIGESIPGGTTTAFGVLSALGEPYTVSSSLMNNPLNLKEEVVAAGLEASGLQAGEATGDPLRALRCMGDPVLAAVTGLAIGAIESDTTVWLAGGTQMLTAGALIRHFGIEVPLGLATTPFVVRDDTIEIGEATHDLGISLSVSDPEFERADHAALNPYVKGAAKEGVGMGGALMLADRRGTQMVHVRDRIIDCYERLVSTNGS